MKELNNLKQAARKLIKSVPILRALTPFAPVMVLIGPILRLIYQFVSIGIYSSLSSIWYLLYLAGLLLCLGTGITWAAGAAFALKALQYIISFFQYASLNNAVYFVFYGVLAFFCLKAYFSTDEGKKVAKNVGNGISSAAAEVGNAVNNAKKNQRTSAAASNAAAASAVGFCTECGAPLVAGQEFCTECGTKISSGAEEPVAPPQSSGCICPNCKSVLPEGSLFCTECGTKL